VSYINLHPATLLLAWIGFTLAIPYFSVFALIAASVLIVVLMLVSGFARCWSLVRRTRVLLIVMLLVYAFATEGTPLFPGWEQAYPSYEGCMAGALQAWRLLLMIAALAVVFAYLPRQKLLAGIYVLLRPLKALGMPIERFAVRLWLTLHYTETAPEVEGLNARWQSALNVPVQTETSITWDVPSFTVQDAVFAFCYFALIGLIVW
jgi:energy-coupling factor transporter transmembrane protein EcfT